jgi:hypothetical protein
MPADVEGSLSNNDAHSVEPTDKVAVHPGSDAAISPRGYFKVLRYCKDEPDGSPVGI